MMKKYLFAIIVIYQENKHFSVLTGKGGEVGMSMYGESEYAEEKNYLFDEIRRFLEEGHQVEELIRIVADAIEYSN